ncbi:alpha/beta hydrolase [Nocardia sp. IBHARD005]|uniref:alpha/beta hydrolase n=1 Tax=Nocardia sp. IBHARD005 TaxID=3457765 RepID=UPI0040588325
MHSLAERVDLVRLHAAAQGLPSQRAEQILATIDTIDDGPTGWSTVWLAAGRREYEQQRYRDAVPYLNLARFPFVATPDAATAHQLCVEAFGIWAASAGVRRVLLPVAGSEVPVWLAERTRAPWGNSGDVLVVCGGIVSIKEQWARFVELGRRFGMTVVLTELPGVGEHPLDYRDSSGQDLSELFDALAAVTPVHRIFASAMSFGGTVALRAAAYDPRIERIFSVGPPMRHLFTDAGWWQQIPQTTKDALAKTTGIAADRLPGELGRFAVTPGELARVSAKVTAIASRRDEIVPPEDVASLLGELRHASVFAFDDVHGSPNHIADTALTLTGELADFADVPVGLKHLPPLIRRARGRATAVTARTPFVDIRSTG